MKTPPAWMFRLATENATVNAFLKLGQQHGFTPQLFEEMAQWLAEQNAELSHLAEKLLKAKPPPPMFVCSKCHKVSFHPEDVRHQYCGACHA